MAVQHVEEWIRQLRFEQARRHQPLLRGVVRYSSPFPLRAG
jgi:hypothetical protein